MVPDFAAIKAVFFDLDDTLCAYWEAARAALAETFEEYRLEGHSPQDMLKFWSREFGLYCPGLKKTEWYAPYLKRGEPSRTELMRRALALAGVHDDRLAREISDFYATRRDQLLKLFDDALPAIEALKGKYYLGMITNGPADVQRGEVVSLGLEPCFQSILIEGELGFGKPNPEIFRLAEQQSGCAPEEVLFVGNSYAHDILPALEVGWRTVWIQRASDVPPTRTGESARPEDLPAGLPEPDMTVKELGPVVSALIGGD